MSERRFDTPQLSSSLRIDPASDAALRVSGLLHCEPVELVAWLPTPKLQPLQTHVTAVALMYCILYTHSPSLTVGLDNAY